MASIALDSGPAIALFSKRDVHHERAVGFIRSVEAGALVTTAAVVTEVAFVLGARAPQFIDWVQAAAEIDGQIGGDLPRIAAILRKYKTLRPDFADASLVALCERRGVGKIATVDSDFAVYRMNSGKALEIVM